MGYRLSSGVTREQEREREREREKGVTYLRAGRDSFAFRVSCSRETKSHHHGQTVRLPGGTGTSGKERNKGKRRFTKRDAGGSPKEIKFRISH